ncbi:hypothetical protein [Paenibacillus sp. NPDC058174]|uniref:hypothetical protein n=1 Tax=Paenibacillus sp. NPDC058174 TaxID=3346366 RepID=UPI0036DCE777
MKHVVKGFVYIPIQYMVDSDSENSALDYAQYVLNDTNIDSIDMDVHVKGKEDTLYIRAVRGINVEWTKALQAD